MISFEGAPLQRQKKAIRKNIGRLTDAFPSENARFNEWWEPTYDDFGLPFDTLHYRLDEREQLVFSKQLMPVDGLFRGGRLDKISMDDALNRNVVKLKKIKKILGFLPMFYGIGLENNQDILMMQSIRLKLKTRTTKENVEERIRLIEEYIPELRVDAAKLNLLFEREKAIRTVDMELDCWIEQEIRKMKPFLLFLQEQKIEYQSAKSQWVEDEKMVEKIRVMLLKRKNCLITSTGELQLL